jgi:hypothetical protein
MLGESVQDAPEVQMPHVWEAAIPWEEEAPTT